MRIERENPARTDELVGAVESSDAAAVDQVVTRAGAAQAEWAAVPVDKRAALLREAAARVRTHLEEIATLTARETGKVLADSRGEAGFAATVLGFYADRGEALLTPGGYDDERGRMSVRHRPYGVVAAVTPWNAPLILTTLKLAPALVSGNAVVVKPSPFAPFGIGRLLELVGQDLPAGLVQVVHGGAETASALVSHPGVHRVAFTGGETAGRAIASLAGRALTPSVLELGGNDPALILDDAALDDAALDRLVMAAFATSGQVCMAVKRLYVHRSRLDEVVSGLESAAARVLRTGDPLHDGVSMGPVVSGASATRVAGLVDQARAAGAAVRELGTVDAASDLARGYYVRPTLVLGAEDSSPIVAEEQFGPTLPVLAFDDVDEAVARANAGDLGLGASVWSADEDRAFDVAARIDAGFAFVNTHNRTGMALHAPFGGVKRSGWGREYGDDGLWEYVQPCVVHAPAAFRAGGAGLAANAYPGS